MSKDDHDRELIRAAMDYRLGDFYMGSMATAGLYHTLGLSYGSKGFDEALQGATRDQLDALLAKCKFYIEFMQDHPVKECSQCGQMVPVTAANC